MHLGSCQVSVGILRLKANIRWARLDSIVGMVPQPCLACRLKLVEVDAWPTVFGTKGEARPAKEDAPSEASSTGGLLRRNDKKSRHRNMMMMMIMMMMMNFLDHR